MITRVACRNRDCPNYNVPKSVPSALILGTDPKRCPKCDGPMKVAEQVNVSGKGRRSRGRRSGR
jgi:hypothetical protein